MPIPSRVQFTLPEWVAARGATTSEPGDRYEGDEAKVALAVALSRTNVERQTGGPFGAVIFDDDDRVVVEAVNVVIPQKSSLGHAETMAFMLAQQHLGRARLNEDGRRYTLAASSQPCCQCYGASIWAGIDVLLIGARSEDVMTLTPFDEGPLPADWVGELSARRIEVRRDVRRDEARAVLADYGRLGGARY